MKRTTLLLPTAIAAAFALGACSPRDNDARPSANSETVGQKVDQAVANAKSGAQEARQETREAANTVANAANDATITTKINAALAADDKLKALQIDVDTSGGRVVLTGTAPDAASKDRATTLARAVEGVVAVDNRLTVDAKG